MDGSPISVASSEDLAFSRSSVDWHEAAMLLTKAKEEMRTAFQRQIEDRDKRILDLENKLAIKQFNLDKAISDVSRLKRAIKIGKKPSRKADQSIAENNESLPVHLL